MDYTEFIWLGRSSIQDNYKIDLRTFESNKKFNFQNTSKYPDQKKWDLNDLKDEELEKYEILFEGKKSKEEVKEEKKNEDEGKALLEKNRENPKITELESGLQYEILVQGNGEIPKITDEVEVEYEGYLLDSQVFDSTKDSGAKVFNIQEMIPGWQEILTKMQEGSRCKVFIPPHLAYGENGASPMILPNATLIFIIELNKIR
jgi:FKBP-type peptidyl-prolyl cis-trans isomerase